MSCAMDNRFIENLVNWSQSIHTLTVNHINVTWSHFIVGSYHILIFCSHSPTGQGKLTKECRLGTFRSSNSDLSTAAGMDIVERGVDRINASCTSVCRGFTLLYV